MEQQKFLKNKDIIVDGNTIPGNEVLNIDSNIFISYVKKNKLVGEETSIVIKNEHLPFNSYFVLKGDWRKEFLACKQQADKVMEIYYNNEASHSSSSSTPEKEKDVMEILKKYPHLEELIKNL